MAEESKILFLDDDPAILSGFKRQLHRKFTVCTADNPTEAMRLLRMEGPFAVVVSDLKMPVMDGIQFLSRLKQDVPDTVRVLLTGHGGMEATLEAINKGHVFRFLNKPCPPEEMEEMLNAAVAQYRLITAERDLLEQTLQSAIQVLAELIGLNNPIAYERTVRAAEIMTRLAKRIGGLPVWQWKAAGMLSQIGWVALSPELLERLYLDKPLSATEEKAVHEHPLAGARLVATIPRLEQVAAMVANQARHYDGSGPGTPGLAGEEIPLGARALKLILDLDMERVVKRMTLLAAIAVLRQRVGWYDPNLLEILELAVTGERKGRIETLPLGKLTAVMTLMEDILTKDGRLIIRRNTMLTMALLERLNLFHHTVGIKEPISVLVPER